MNRQYLSCIEKKPDANPDYYEFPFCLPVIKNLNKLEFDKPVTFLIGDNGTGKSTIIEAIATSFGFNPEGGSKNFNFSTHDTHSGLYKYLRLVKGAKMPKDGYFLRAESFYNLATNIEELGLDDSYGGRSLHGQSHGEGFLSLIKNRLLGNGLYIFDEPEAALSTSNTLAMLKIIDDLVKMNSQFIIATHSPILIAYPNAMIYEIDQNQIRQVEYTQTTNYIVTKYFINNYGKMLSDLEISRDT